MLSEEVSAAWAQHYQVKAASSSHLGNSESGVGEEDVSALGAKSDLNTKVDVVSKLRRRVARKTIHSTAAGQKNWNLLQKEAFKVGKDVRRQRLHRVWARVYHHLEAMLESSWFDQFIALGVLLNGVCVALEVDIDPHGSHGYYKGRLDLLEGVFALLFVLEAVARVCVGGWQHYVHNHKLELFLVVVSLVDRIASSVQSLHNYDVGLSLLSMLRLARFTRFFEHGELAIISTCFFPAFRTLAHVSCFLFIIIFVFSVPAVRLIGQSVVWSDVGLPEVSILYGSMPRAVFGLLQMMFNPDTALMRDVGEHLPWTGPFFILFLGMTNYTTVAIITGGIVDSYNQKADEVRAAQARDERIRHEKIRARLLHQFTVADKQELHLQGVLSSYEFKRCLSSRWCQDGLMELGLDDEACQTLLKMLEIAGHVHYEEFIEALGHMGQSAQAIDILSLRAHVSEELRTVEIMVQGVESRLNKRLDALEEKLFQRLDQALAK